MRIAMFIPLLLLGTVTSLTIKRHHKRHIHSRTRHLSDSTQDRSVHAIESNKNGAAVSASSLLDDAMHHVATNHLGAGLRFRSRAPFREGDNTSKKTLGLHKPTGGDKGSDSGEGEDDGDDDNDDKDSIYKVVPGAPDGVKMEPMPGMKDPTVYVRAANKFDKAGRITRGFVLESQLTSIDKIKRAIDVSENRIKGLKLRVVEKQNFLDSLRKRERILASDVSQDQAAVHNLLSHIDALDLRLTRLKKEDELKQLSAMYANYTSKAMNLEGQAAGLSSARDALFNRIQTMHNTIGGLRQREETNARMAVDGEDDPLQTYGYAGALRERKESLQNDMALQMQQMGLQQQLLQQQLGLLTGTGNATNTAPAAKGSGKGKAKAKGSGAGKPPAGKKAAPPKK